MARSPVRTLLVIAAIVLFALLVRWIGGDWLMDNLRSMHGPPARH